MLAGPAGLAGLEASGRWLRTLLSPRCFLGWICAPLVLTGGWDTNSTA